MEALRMNDHIFHTVSVVDDVSPEDVAMMQALYSRSPESSGVHLAKVRKSGSGKFMSSHYVGYGHKSIADCGSTTIFIENVSLLAAKAIQDWPLYCGQETSTRYINMEERDIEDPVGSPESTKILDRWMGFYTSNQERVADTIRFKYPIREGEDPKIYEKAVKARVFDVLRGFLPAGITTQLSWHTNLRQASDHLIGLRNHPASEIRALAETITNLLHQKYPSSGFVANMAGVSGVGSEGESERHFWERRMAKKYAYVPPMFPLPSKDLDDSTLIILDGAVVDEVRRHLEDINSRPRGCVLPHFMSDFGQVSWNFILDFGAFRDIQRHRNGVCRMPLLTDEYGFEPWYLEQLDQELAKEAKDLICKQEDDVARLTEDPVVRQYYLALGYRVRTDVTYGLPAAVYVMELRSGKSIHPTLRKKIHAMIRAFRKKIPEMTLHVDMDPSDWDVRRGAQTITQK
jgi:thymidylate synthase ThyX